MTNKILEDIQKMCGERGDGFDTARQAIQKFVGDNSPEAQMRKDLENTVNGIERGRNLVSQIIGRFPGTEHLNHSAEFRNQVSALQEYARVQRQIQSFGFPDFETLHYQIADYQARMERKEMLKARLEEIRNAKLKPIVPEIKIENITIEIHLHEKPDEGE